MGRVCDVMEILQSRLATATSRPPARDIRDTVNPPRGFDQSAMLTSYRVWDYGVNLMSWSNFCVLVWLFLPWRDFFTLSDIIRTCSHVMYDVITLWWSRESWYDFSPSWTKFLSWWDLVCLVVILYLAAINRILVWFFFLLDTMFVLVRLYLFWGRFISWCDQLHLGMIFLHFTRLFRLSMILVDLV